MHYCFLSNFSIGHHLGVLTVDCETGQSLRHRVMIICNIELPFYSGWPEISNCAHELIRKVFTEFWSEGCFSIRFHRSKSIFATTAIDPWWPFLIRATSFFCIVSLLKIPLGNKGSVYWQQDLQFVYSCCNCVSSC